jgi:hemolysin-activating ACP:hemolysin acyltransferase
VIDFLTNDEKLTISEIGKLMEQYDTHRVFETRHRWRKEFEEHFRRIIEARQVVTFRENEKLVGFCSWAIVDKERKLDINKARWTLPEDISSGDILYIDACVLRSPSNIFKIREYLTKEVVPLVKEVYWFNSPGGRVFRSKFNGGVLCQTAA